jgi:hypothetical protein
VRENPKAGLVQCVICFFDWRVGAAIKVNLSENSVYSLANQHLTSIFEYLLCQLLNYSHELSLLYSLTSKSKNFLEDMK